MFTARIVVVILFVLDIGCCEIYHRMIAFYQDLGCIPIDGDKYYDCSEVIEVDTPQQCRFRGHRYNLGHFLDTTDGSANSCRIGCICTASENFFDSGYFSCPEVDCSVLNESEPDCRQVFSSVDSCCPDVIACGPSNVTCNYNGRIYQKGEMFFPETNPCLQCLCDEHFHTAVEGGCAGRPRMVSEGGTCKTVLCSVQLDNFLIDDVNNYCAPIFKPGLCCPVEFYCPNRREQVIAAEQGDVQPASTAIGGEQVIGAEQEGDEQPTDTGRPSLSDLLEGDKCRLGSLLLNIGDIVVPRDPSIHCQCFIPPFLTCWSK